MRANSVLGVLFSDANSDKINRLTSVRTIASVPFGGKYRFIDFMLSNMVNAGISKVGVFTSSNYRSLMDHLGTGNPWDLSRKTDGLFLLPPFTAGNSERSGSKLEALKNRASFFRRSDQDIVVLCDTNIICTLDFAALVDYHIAKGADITICTKRGRIPKIDNVLLPETDADGRVTKLTVPSVCESGEGLYGVNIIVMRKATVERFIFEAENGGAVDFERDCLQASVDKINVYAYDIDTYCSVIDSVNGYFETSMDLLKPEVRRALFNKDNPVYTKVKDDMPSTYGMQAKVSNCFDADGCLIEGRVENSIISRGVHIGKGAVVTNSILMPGAYIDDNATVNCVILDKGVIVKSGKNISGAETYPIYIGKNIVI